MSDRTSISKTKKKFSQSVFRAGIGDRQQSFWANVQPVESRKNGMRANIPTDRPQGNFIGRKKTIKRILDEIVGITNENAIVFGPGGVGKTALMIELSNTMFDALEEDEVPYNNLIWVSAKRDYYNPVFNTIESKPQQISTLDDIFSAIFAFFGYSDMDDYNYENREFLVFDILSEHKVLLILDNFETIATKEQALIVKFFGTKVKQKLRNRPDYFKVLITSREQIPSGFNQVELKGLDKRESKCLMDSLFKAYKDSSKPQLSLKQQDRLHDLTSGIPIVINHCYARVFEYNDPFKDVVEKLTTKSTNVVDFSFSEIFGLLSRNIIQLRIVILLELINVPLLLRQIANVLGYTEPDVDTNIKRLISFQCIQLSHYKMEHKYSINNNMRLFAKRVIQDNSESATRIKQKIEEEFSLENRMDYTQQEYDTAAMFSRYITDDKLREAEDFIEEELQGNPDSILLNYKYAEYLHENRHRTNKAIEILEKIRKDAANDPLILIRLVEYYSVLDIPKFEEAETYTDELKAANDEAIWLSLAKFYASWSTWLKKQPKSSSIVQETSRQKRYKELAGEAIQVLNKISCRTHEHFYLKAQSYYNEWKYDLALSSIEKAIKEVPGQLKG